MITKTQQNTRGFTLIEMLLVLVIISAIILMSVGYLQQRTLATRVDRTATQMQQILNAAMSYYVVNGSWPPSLACLQGQGGTNCAGTVVYLPPTMISPFGETYTVLPSASSATGAGGTTVTVSPLVYVYTSITSATASGSSVSAANIIAGKLPLSYTTATAPTSGTAPPPSDGTCVMSGGGGGGGGGGPATCYIVASVNIPGQNLNNATAVNYGGLYHNGACVPAPTCPVDKNGQTMNPEIMVVPVSVSGVNDQPQPPGSGNTPVVYPISSFSAYAQGDPTSKTGAPITVTGSSGPPVCKSDTGTNTICYSDMQNGTPITSGKYWRVCLQVVTEKGPVSWGSDTTAGTTNSSWGEYATILAITRCTPQSEPTGSGFNVWAP